MDNLLSCNLGSYGKFRDTALEHLVSIGVKHVEIPTPAPADVAAVKANFDAHGLSATTLMAPCPIADEGVVESFKPVMEAASVFGAKAIFVSVKAAETPLDLVYDRLRQVGDLAVAAGVKLAMETHPDLCDNGSKMAETMAALNHPGVGVNFDTANIYYYNEGCDAVAELAKALDHVAAVHLKDTDGSFHGWAFGALGEGVVDFPRIFKMLNDRDFYGPFTMELEGKQGEDLSQAEKSGRVTESVEYLRQSGLVP